MTSNPDVHVHEEDIRTATRDVEGQLRQLAAQSLVFLRQNCLSILYNGSCGNIASVRFRAPSKSWQSRDRSLEIARSRASCGRTQSPIARNPPRASAGM